MIRQRPNFVRWLARRLPSRVVARLNRAQFRYPLFGRLLKALARVAASGETMIDRGPAAGLRIDAAGSNAGYALGTSEPEEQQWLCRHIEPGEVLFDVGANIGFITLLGGRLVGANGAVVAFEPLPQNLVQLEKNVALNGFDQVTVVAAAVSDTPGTASLAVTQEGGVFAHLVTSQSDDAPTVEVEVVTIDEWLYEGSGRRPPTVIKIDVEGAELNVLRGARRTLEEWRPKILVEVHWLGQDFIDYVDQDLVPLGYLARRIDGRPLAPDLVRYHAELLIEGADGD